ncbi:hypothetical protein AVEN_97049-1 [Araneus ventricosus]|uniref:Uncharacterized protein n=1 Tax=Araneus ventricosus TaxID=182803 RepID=A0A4Y2RB72_ARAVE|nr:hypothetical protein AVEN_97049-1 [Araneus ventricosus]
MCLSNVSQTFSIGFRIDLEVIEVIVGPQDHAYAMQLNDFCIVDSGIIIHERPVTYEIITHYCWMNLIRKNAHVILEYCPVFLKQKTSVRTT